jgi:hypothetical protein
MAEHINITLLVAQYVVAIIAFLIAHWFGYRDAPVIALVAVVALPLVCLAIHLIKRLWHETHNHS